MRKGKRMRKRGRKILAACGLAVCLTVSFTACQKGGKEPAASDASFESRTEEFRTTEAETARETESPEETTVSEGTEPETMPEETTPEETTETVLFTEVNETVYCSDSQVNVRRAPGTYGEKIGVLSRNEELTRTGIGDNGWSRVIYQGEEAYVHSDYLSTEKQEKPTSSVSAEGIPGTGIYHAGTNGILVAIDAGHQLHGSSTKEPNGPGSSEMKARVTSGTSGCVSGLDEYVLNLTVSLQLRDALLAEGYSVLMIRETHDVDISNAERAVLANEAGADIFLRVHANSSSDSSVKGALTMAPSGGNPYCSGIAGESQRLSQLIVDGMCAQTGFRNRGVMITDTMTGINWCEVPVSIIEMGFMSNPEEDAAMATAEVQQEIVRGIVNGVNSYFGR